MIINGVSKKHQKKVLFEYEEDSSTNYIANLAKIGNVSLTHYAREIAWFCGQVRNIFR